jgi:hypothetical protein
MQLTYVFHRHWFFFDRKSGNEIAVVQDGVRRHNNILYILDTTHKGVTQTGRLMKQTLR